MPNRDLRVPVAEWAKMRDLALVLRNAPNASNEDIAVTLGIPRATTYRHVARLQQLTESRSPREMVERLQDGRLTVNGDPIPRLPVHLATKVQALNAVIAQRQAVRAWQERARATRNLHRARR